MVSALDAEVLSVEPFRIGRSEEGVSAVIDRRMHIPMLAVMLAVGATASGLTAAPSPSETQARPATAAPRVAVASQINPLVTRRLRTTARRWEAVMGRQHVRSTAALNTPRALRFWRRRARRVLSLAVHPPHRRAWLCIHRYEASWSDSGDPYWGGLQMDRGFMGTYAPRLLLRRGLADRWTVLEQMWVAERAHRSGRGYTPWLNTARLCGLL
jgi:hypothetical protein